MKRTLITAAVLLALAALCPWSALADAMPDSFVPAKFVAAVNEALPEFAGKIMNTSTASEVSEAVSYCTLAYTEADGGMVYYNNSDWSIEASAYYESGTADVNTPAYTVNLIFPEALGDGGVYLMRAAMVYAILSSDQQADYQSLLDWMDEATATGEVFHLNGYCVLLVHEEGRWQYALLPPEAVENGAAAPTSSPSPGDLINPKPGTFNNPRPSADPAPTAAAPARSGGARVGDTLVDRDGYKVQLLRIEPKAFYDGTVCIWFCCRFINNGSRPLCMLVRDASVNGIPCHGVGSTDIYVGMDTGPDSEKFFFIEPDEGGSRSSFEAVCNPRIVKFNFYVMETETWQELYDVSVSIDMSDVPAFTPRPTAAPTPTPAPTKNPASLYTTLTRGDSGEDVRRLQSRLIELGYLFDTADGRFGAKTAAAVWDFCVANGLTGSEIATPEMQARLYSGSARAFEEPYVSLIIKNGAYGQWQKASGDRIQVRVEVTNSSRTRTVKAFEIYMYAEDVWGERIYGANQVYIHTTTRNVSPGQTVYCDYMTMPNRSRVSKVYAGVSKIVYTDGTVREASGVDYSSWNVSW